MNKTRLLVVDDDRTTSVFLERVLTQAGYAVTVAADGRSALALLDTAPDFHTVLLDRQMPDLDGLQVLQHMKDCDRLKGIPVVLQTVIDSEDEIQKGLQAGALYYLVKPLDPRLVLQVVAAATADYADKRLVWEEMEGLRSALGLVRRGVFRYQTLRQCHDLTALLAQACPDPKRTVTGLSELMINALEHGNLGITYNEKSALIEARTWAAEIERRQQSPEHQDKWVTVSVVRSATRTRFRIQDMGRGFAWTEFQEVSQERLFDNHGRGILLAKWEAFDRVQYLGNGDCVIAEVWHS
jgi:DNA-binding response OmpR family regulator